MHNVYTMYTAHCYLDRYGSDIALVQSETTNSFGYWVRRRRLALDLTQSDLARAVNCARVTIAKIERDERRPSRQMANLLAHRLAIPPDQLDRFVDMALGEWAPDRLPLADQSLKQHVASPSSLSAGAVIPTHKTNLPSPLTSFVGRTQELAEITRAVTSHRLVTLTGAGGVGKTRLAVEAAIRLVSDGSCSAFSDGVWMVELATLASERADTALDTAGVAQVVANLFRLTGPTGRTAMALLQEALTSKHMLLILDNCEHLVQGCAEMAEQLLHHCWKLHILATSREELRIPGEVVYPVLPLALPDQQERSPACVLATPAAQLFLERMGKAISLRHVQDEDTVAIAHICRQLGGIPLALELAAPLARSLTLAEIASQLHDQMAILTNSYRTAIPRHQTMHSTLVWSYRLLSSAEQLLLANLSVFAGSWTSEACDVVGGAAPRESLVHLLHQLVAKSLVLLEYTEGERRYRMLEPIRQFAYAQLAASNALNTARRRHADYYLALAEHTSQSNHNLQEREWLQRLALEVANLRVVNEWALEQDEAEFANRFNRALFPFWVYSSTPAEAQHWLDTASVRNSSRRTPAACRAEATALHIAGHIAMTQGDYLRAQGLFEHELTLYLEVDDRRGIAAGLRGCGHAAMQVGDVARAHDYTSRGLEVARAAQDRYSATWALLDLGYQALMRDDAGGAWVFLEESLTEFRALEVSYGAFRALFGLAYISGECGETAQARALCHDALQLQQQMRYVQSTAECLECLAGIEAKAARPTIAARLFGAAHAHREATAVQRFRYLDNWYTRDFTLARSQLEPDAWDAAWMAGTALTLDQAVTLALAE